MSDIEIPERPTHAAFVIDNYDGEGDMYWTFAFECNGVFYSFEFNPAKPLIEYEGDKILQVVDLNNEKKIAIEGLLALHEKDREKVSSQCKTLINMSTVMKYLEGLE